MSDDKDSKNAFEPMRSQVKVGIGAIVQHGESSYRIIQVLDFNVVIGTDLVTGRSTSLRVGELKPVENESAMPFEDLANITDEAWQVAQERFAAISPLAGKLIIGRDEAERRAKEVNVNTATLYRWLKRYNATGSVTALIPMQRGWSRGKRRISSDSEDVIQQVINDFYLTVQRPSAKHAIEEVKTRCLRRGIEPPSHMTIRARLAEIPERKRLHLRGYKEKAQNRYTPVPGEFPNADYPLSVIQIDHTPADIILVDDIHRLPIGRPWITMAIDVFSRMVTGVYVSFDAPSETSVAMCVASSILPKEEWLLRQNIDVAWPVWGVPRTIHVDNGSEFRSNGFRMSCLNYGINLEFRPVKQPRYGGHIERLLGTFLQEMHSLPGTTFSSVKDRDGYDSEKHAAMTRSDFEHWLLTRICKIYHQKKHSSLEIRPLRKWEIGIFGNAEVQGVGISPRPADRLTVLLDFLPAFHRTIQNFGVTIDGLTYYADALRLWINATDSESGDKRKFVFRRDPRDISTVWFFDPDLKQYFKVPFANQALPSMSIWEYRQARERLRRDNADGVSEHEILKAITELRSLVDEAVKKTKKARRQAQKRKEHSRQLPDVLPALTTDLPTKPISQQKVITDNSLLDGDIDTYGDIA
jgi:putative transposase